jgi:hypothetical protein
MHFSGVLFLGPIADKNRGSMRFLTPQNSRISRISNHRAKYRQNDEFCDFGAFRIWLSRSLRFKYFDFAFQIHTPIYGIYGFEMQIWKSKHIFTIARFEYQYSYYLL